MIKEIKTKNEKTLGKMKDELGGEIYKEFIGLKSKMYALDIKDESFNKEKNKSAKE